MKAITKRGCFDIFLGITLFLIDRVTKNAALASLQYGVSVPIASLFGIQYQLTLTTNEGAAWGALTDWKEALFYIRLIFIGILFVSYLWFCTSSFLKSVLIMIIAGACGNIIDTIFWGHVIDMLHISFWGWDYPVFNVADIYISVGCILFFLQSLIAPKGD
jgi:signal peptidase II